MATHTPFSPLPTEKSCVNPCMGTSARVAFGGLIVDQTAQVLTKRDEGELEGLPAADTLVAGTVEQGVGGGAAVAHRQQILGGQVHALDFTYM